ncbi:alpha/beta fold hydrolase [Saccharothrix sp. Mg75]|uniref:alpha/beta fold hydrolase n=1 Tax=Saccharothrix sp. Mg75 TaxID=3445357 RepID=UPI003EF02D33
MIVLPESGVRTYEQSDGYVTHYRLWGAPEGDDVVVVLHGGVSHSGWQAPLAEAVVENSEVSFIAPDRRGSGLNTVDRGHLESTERVIGDVVEFVRSLKGSFRRVHLAGWCFGGQVASVAAAQVADEDVVSSLTLIAPGFYFNERYGDVLRLSVESALEVVREFGLVPEPTRAFITVPLQPTDFTSRPDWQEFVVDDGLRLVKVTEGMVEVCGEIAARAVQEFSRTGDVPVLVVFGTQDRLVDVERVREFVVAGKAPAVENLRTGHAVHFEEPGRLAEIILAFLPGVRSQPAGAAASTAADAHAGRPR